MSQITDAIAYAKQHIADGEHMDDLQRMVTVNYPRLDPRQVLILAGGFIEGWDEKKGVVRKRGRVGV